MPKRVLVTGGTGTVGSEIVRVLQQGVPIFEVTANFCRDRARAAELQRETTCLLHQCDVGEEAQVDAMFDELPPLFAVVHAAGVAHDGLLLRQSSVLWNDALRVNADAAFLVARNALQKLENGGRLVFLASRVGEQGRAGQASYGAGKAAMLALMKCAAREGASRRIAVNAVCPGFVPSAMGSSLDAAHLEKARQSSASGAFGRASETASLVQWLLSDVTGEISGQVFHADNRL